MTTQFDVREHADNLIETYGHDLALLRGALTGALRHAWESGARHVLDGEPVRHEIAQAIWNQMSCDRDQCDLSVYDVGSDDILWRCTDEVMWTLRNLRISDGN